MKLRLLDFSLGLATVICCGLSSGATASELKVRVSWGHNSPRVQPFTVRLTGRQLDVVEATAVDFEPGDTRREGTWQTSAGGGDVDGVEFTLFDISKEKRKVTPIHSTWKYLMAHHDPDSAGRLRDDAVSGSDPRKLTVLMDTQGTRGFSVTVEQLERNRSIWVPSLDLYITRGDRRTSFADHQQVLKAAPDRRVLDLVESEPEATYSQYTARWEDMGHPGYVHPSQPAPGHIVGLSWDSSIHKFGIDRGAGVRNDYGNPDQFRFWYDIGDLSSGIVRSWKSQQLKDGYPVITTTLERDGVRYEIEQFAYPLKGPPSERRGDIPMVLLQRMQLRNLESRTKSISVKLSHQRPLSPGSSSPIAPQAKPGALLFSESVTDRVLFSVEGAGVSLTSCTTREEQPRFQHKKDAPRWKTVEPVLAVELPGQGTGEFVVKLPSPPLVSGDQDTLLALDYAVARGQTLKFWANHVARGAQFQVPEKVVNDLFRASLWHALRLPRRHGGQEPGVQIDLPYSNFAYDQRGTPWPINQAVYVDYMIHDLRGYHDVSLEELLAMYRNNQEPNGHVAGYANWGVYTPSMIYVSAKHYLLSQDDNAFERLLPYTLKALDWCLHEIETASERSGPARGLLQSPLNDGTGEGVWAFTQAYVYAGMSLLGKALAQYGHPRAEECTAAADSFRKSVLQAFGEATVLSPLVQLRDHTWIPYVPCEALTPRRLLDQWYPTDVDTGATHLIRLNALPAEGALADYLLHDHEDNLYWKGWGMANEPVYNSQATAYLLRDKPEAVIRAFYSYLACAFSHSALEPVEHRWHWGQYFGPPSTDGAWFELYRNMLIRELDDDTLLLLQASPRVWLADGKRIVVERAPTHYGELSFVVESQAASGRLLANLRMPGRRHPGTLLVRLRHPDRKSIRSVSVNGRQWTDYNAQKEWVRIPHPDKNEYSIIVGY